MSTYTDRVDVLKNPMLRVGRPVVVLFDLTDGSQVALNSVDATEWRARDPKRYSLTSTGDDMKNQIEPRITGPIVISSNTGGAIIVTQLIFDTVTGQTIALPSCDYREWLSRGGGRYQPAS
jgi:hypothetical protein